MGGEVEDLAGEDAAHVLKGKGGADVEIGCDIGNNAAWCDDWDDGAGLTTTTTAARTVMLRTWW